MSFILVALVFVPVFLINLQHLRVRHIPLYTWGSVIAVFHLAVGCVSALLIPCAAMLVSAVIELVYYLMTTAERASLEKQYESENQEVAATIEQAQQQFEKLHLLAFFTYDQEYQYRLALKALDDVGIWYLVKNGLLTSIFVRPEDTDRAEAAAGIVPERITPESVEPPAPGTGAPGGAEPGR